MSILAHLIHRRNSKRYARPSAPVRESRRNPKATPFADGLFASPAIRSVKQWVAGDIAFDLTEDDRWFEVEGGYPFTLHWFTRGEADSKGFDRESDAMLYAWHMSTPLPSEEVPPACYADEPPVLEDSACFEPSQTDIEWHAAHEHEVASELDTWLDTLAPEDYDSLGFVEGGAW